ncbi:MULTISPECIES: porin family protein [Segatella]|uniref:Outer membrane protein beta-barrel domain-containing protein n=2 Tax=Segatella TaxID=2974251 RepID=D8DU39_9BACT|nr:MULTISPECIES: porin family protein [Segatella]EFI72984.1 conserved hypothetical protein [Segatella baroniae B14]UKK77738.1 porin family protein [Segatella baroniae B14]GJG27997.1 membrane protein [Segatella bryantii]SEQ91169.1 outer membrane autotransporter barrel domain-containing protein [Segatella baroniae B14]
MKKLFSALLVVMCLMATSVNAQTKFGIKAGIDATSMSLNSEEVFKASNRAGFFVGPMVKFTLPIIGLGVDAAALYDNRTSKVANESAASSESIKQQSILIPVNVRYGVGLGDAANIFLFAGPQWAINVGDSEFKWNSTDSYSLKKSTFSINVGIGATLLSHIQLTANYNIACGKSANLDVWDAVSNATKSYNSRNNTWQIGAAYLF